MKRRITNHAVKQEPGSANDLVDAVLARKSRALQRAIAAGGLVNKKGSLGISPLGAALYGLWSPGVAQLLKANAVYTAEDREMLCLGVKDAKSQLVGITARYGALCELVEISHMTGMRHVPVDLEPGRILLDSYQLEVGATYARSKGYIEVADLMLRRVRRLSLVKN